MSRLEPPFEVKAGASKLISSILYEAESCFTICRFIIWNSLRHKRWQNIYICYVSVRLTNLKQYPVDISKIIAMINLYGRLKLVWEWLDKDILYPAGKYMFKVTKKRCEICSKLTIKATERRSSAIVNFEQANAGSILFRNSVQHLVFWHTPSRHLPAQS